MQVGCIIGKGGLTGVWYIRSGVVAGCDWAKKPKTEPGGLGFCERNAGGAWFGVKGTWAGTAGVSGAGGGGGY